MVTFILILNHWFDFILDVIKTALQNNNNIEIIVNKLLVLEFCCTQNKTKDIRSKVIIDYCISVIKRIAICNWTHQWSGDGNCSIDFSYTKKY